MWNRLLALGMNGPSLLTSSKNTYQQLRTTFILKRRWPPGLHKKWQTYRSKPLKSRNFVYDLVEDTNCRKRDDLEVILTEYVSDIGNPGDIVKMKQKFVYNNLLLPGFAVYASEENIKKYSHLSENVEKRKFSSPYVQGTINNLLKTSVIILMNKDVPWTIQPWHIRASFRKAGIHVPEDSIRLPEEPISGPNMDFEGKYFEVTITINNVETVSVKCQIHHWTGNISDRLPPLENNELPMIPLFPNKSDENITH
ncbi:hypothetical protein C0J52_15825 [Blattella germanica]|nr:hypothetical protein C0J52_15825 [Blattella germanica]